MSDHLNQLLIQAILAAQARFENEEIASVNAAKAFAAGHAAYEAAINPPEVGLQKEIQVAQ